jgi:uncharacterized protein YxjI
MRYQMKQKFFGRDGTFTIDDEAGKPVYKAQAKALSLMKKIDLFDMADNQVSHVEHKFGMLPTYEITLTGQSPVRLKKGFAWLGKKFVLDMPNAPVEIKSNWSGLQYKFTQGGQEIASASKKAIAMADTFAVDVPEGKDPILILSAMAAVDMILHSENK